MRAILLLVLLAGQSGDRFPDKRFPERFPTPHAERYPSPDGEKALLYAPLSSNGLEAADPATSWPVTGVAAPDVAWWGDDPTGSGGRTTHAFTAYGSTTEVNTPFCPDGSWSDLTSGCLKARRFDGSNDYYLSANGVGNIASGDFTLISIYRTDQNSAGTIACQREGPGGEGWSSQADYDTWSAQMVIENHAASAINGQQNDVKPGLGGWVIAAAAFDYDADLHMYTNANEDGSTWASPGGTIDVTGQPLSIGAREVDQALKFSGDLLALFLWNSYLDSVAVAKVTKYFEGILDEKGTPVACTTVGPNTCWIDGQLESFGDDFCALGCEMPPGATGSGSPAGGLLHMESLTNSAVYSRQIDQQTPIGTPTETATSVDLFRDGRQTVRICDDDGAAVEGESFAVDVTALDASDDVQICVYAKDSAGTVLDLQVDESGVCGGSTIDFAAKTISTSWTQYEWTHTLADGTCTTATYKISPTDWGTVASTTCAEYVVQAYKKKDKCPPLYIETEAAAVGAGDSEFYFDISGTSIVDGSGNLTPGITVSIDVAQDGDWFSGSLGPTVFFDSASGQDYVRQSWGNGDYKIQARSSGNGHENIYDRTGGAHAPTAGTTYTMTWTPGPTVAPTLAIDGVDQPGTAAAYSQTQPDSIDRFEINGSNGSSQDTCWVSEIEVTSP